MTCRRASSFAVHPFCTGLGLFDLLVLVQDLQERVDEEGLLEACCSSGWNGRDLTTDGAGEGELSLLVSNDQLDEALSAEDMEALEYLWVSVSVQANGAVELLIHFLNCLFSHHQLKRTSLTAGDYKKNWVGPYQRSHQHML